MGLLLKRSLALFLRGLGGMGVVQNNGRAT